MKKELHVGAIKKFSRSVGNESSCCPPAETADTGAAGSCCGGAAPIHDVPEVIAPPAQVVRVNSEWTLADHIGQIKCRLSAFRMGYTVKPGLYAAGNPDKESDVVVTANYKLSFDVLRRALKGMDVWILVLDTKGINVWCAAGKGTFGTEELAHRILETGLKEIINHNRIIVPQLGAPGVAAHLVKKSTGLKVHYGPVYAHDIPAYIKAGYSATKDMRTIGFSLSDRLVLTPMELIPALKHFPLYALVVFALFGLKPAGIIFKDAWLGGAPFLLIGILTILAGAFITPLLINVIPFRAFAVKGWIMGMIMLLATSGLTGVFEMDKMLQAVVFLLFPFLSSYLALQFTGSTVFTGMSGVKRELKYAIPLYLLAAGISLALLLMYKLKETGIL